MADNVQEDGYASRAAQRRNHGCGSVKLSAGSMPIHPVGGNVAYRHTTGHFSRSKAPVFVLGAPRSGTTVLYHMLLSAGNFAVYRAESNVFSVLQPRFGNLARRSRRNELLRSWLRRKLFSKKG